MNVSITPVKPEELKQLLEISKQTFITAFGAANSPGDMALYTQEKFTLPQITTEFEHPESLFFFARINQEIVGYLKLNTGEAQTESLLENALEIERIYVLTGHQGKNIGRQLLEFTLNLSKQKQLEQVWLGVWEHNTHAIRFYERYGFKVFTKHPFYLGNDKQTDLLMKQVINT